MPRLMSVAYTEASVWDRTKTVTRRKGWWEDKNGRRILKPGDRLTLCRKVMGRKPGEPIVTVALVEVVSVEREELAALTMSPAYGAEEMTLEGFPGMDPVDFIQRYFVEAQGMDPLATVTRIEWKYLDEPEGGAS